MAVGNSGSRLLGNTEFYGGLSTDRKIGIENSYYDGECLDVRKSPSQMTVLPMSRELADKQVITGLPVAMTQTKDGNIWMADEKGQLYKIDENNGVSKIATGATSSGFGLESFEINDSLWMTDGGRKLLSYGPVLDPGKVGAKVNEFTYLQDESEYISSGIYIQQRNSQVFYQSDPSKPRDKGDKEAVMGGMDEAEAGKILFLPGVQTLSSISVYIANKNGATGTIQAIIHDENNNTVGKSAPQDLDAISNGTMVDFSIYPDPQAPESPSNQTNVVPWAGETLESGSVLHIHLVCTSGNVKVKSYDEASAYRNAYFLCFGKALTLTFNGKHPMAVFDKLYIGNGRYVATLANGPINAIGDTWYIPHALRLDDGYEVCSFGSSDEYLMIGAEKYSRESKRGFQAGRIYFWDRLSEGVNFYIDCPMGSPKTIYNYGNITYIIIRGALYAYTGGKELIKVRKLKGTDTELSGRNTTTEVYPNMMTIRKEILMVGFPSETTANSVRFGIHGWGSVDKNYPNCFTYDYRVPAMENGKTVEQYNSNKQRLRIGCVYNFGDSLFYGYEYTKIAPSGEETTDVALAIVDNESGTSDTFFWKSLQYDAGAPALEKEALRIGIYMDPLPEGTEITPIYRIDDGEWQIGSGSAVAKDRYITCEVNERIHEFQYGFIGTTKNRDATPVIKQVGAEIRVNNEEAKL